MSFLKRNIKLVSIIIQLIIRGELVKYKREVGFLIKHGLNTYPYDYIFKYNVSNEKIGRNSLGNTYVLHGGRQLFFPTSEKYSEELIKKTHLLSTTEQDIESPHRYLDEDENMEKYVFFDIGCQEASLPLEFVDKLKHLYLFEVDSEWNNPLERTYAEWADKVTIINKYVGDNDSDNTIRLSSFISHLQQENQLDLSCDKIFIKMDIEGAEESVFADLLAIMKQAKNMKIALCLYHKYNTENRIREMVPDGYYMRTRDTYMLFQPLNNDCRYPFFRHGVARVERIE